jgi:hypothetical protein
MPVGNFELREFYERRGFSKGDNRGGNRARIVLCEKPLRRVLFELKPQTPN